MFFLMCFTKDVIISPSDLSKDLKKIIRIKLIDQVTGTCNEKYGYFIKVISIGEIKNGIIMDGTGDIIFKMTYQVAVLRPFKDEVCDGVIENIFEREGGIHVRVGPMLVLIAADDIPNKYKLDKIAHKYINTDDESDILEVGEKVRFRYKEIQFDETDFKPIGTMLDRFLGHIRD